MNLKIPKEELSNFFNSLKCYVILRNFDIYGNLERGGDIDILVDDIKHSEKMLFHHLGRPLFIAKRSYVRGYYYEWGYIDFFPMIEWHGASLVSNKALLNNVVKSNDGQNLNNSAYEAFLCWFVSLLWGGFFKERYKDLIVETANNLPEELFKTLENSFGEKLAKKLLLMAQEGKPEKSVELVHQLRKILWKHAFTNQPFQTFRNWLKFWYYEIRLRLNPPVPWIAVLGPDGSGKSSVLSLLKQTMPQVISDVKIFHWRPSILKGNRDNGNAVTNPHAKPERNAFISIIKLLFLWLDWFFGYWAKIANLRVKKNLVVFDRYFLDIIVDPKRYRYGGSKKFAMLFSILIPKPNLVFLLDADPEILQSRKKEVSFSETKRQRKEYLNLVKGLPNGIILDASKPMDEVALDLKEQIIKYLKETH